MIPTELFQEHIDQVSAFTQQSLEHASSRGSSFDGILFHAGTPSFYHADDHPVNFHTVPHFARFAPLPGADHIVHFRPGETPTLYWVAPKDYWYEAPPVMDHPFADALEVVEVGSLEEALQDLPDISSCAYIGNAPAPFEGIGLKKSAIEPEALMSALDWFRAYKTAYEIECIKGAVEKAARGYQAVAELVANGESERHLHAMYLLGSGQLELETPYGNIIGWDSNAATLHYQSKSAAAPNPGHTFLIDAGAAHLQYASDMTRTYFRGDAHPVFLEIRRRIDASTLDGVSKCVDQGSFVALHETAHHVVAHLMADTGIATISAEEILERGLTQPFFPHGLGHHLGLQVHDVGGRQVDMDGTILPPSENFPFLRTTRPIENGMVLTIEPGFYFIPVLLNEHRGDPALNWKLIDELLPLGGVRVEDDVLVTENGPVNLSRDLIPQPL